MRLHRFYIDNTVISGFLEVGGTIKVSSPQQIHQWKNVFRLTVGDEVILFNGMKNGEYRTKFTALTKTAADLIVLEYRPGISEPSKRVALYMALIKKDRFEWVIEKATEMGISRFCPIISERTEIKNLNTERTQKIITEATEQAGWCQLPSLEKITTISVALEQAVNPIICDISSSALNIPLTDVLPAPSLHNGVSIFIGPEGGWSPTEKALFAEKKVPTLSFGHETLRAETAAIVATALILFSPALRGK